MKIALVCPYDFVYPGGVAIHISALEHHFTGMGHDVRVIAPASKVITDFGDRFIPIGKPYSLPSSGSVIRVPLSLNLASTIKTILAREQFDIVHLHEPFMPMLCSAMLRVSDTVNVGTFHASDGSPGYNFGWPISRIMLNRRVGKLDGKIAVSEPAREYADKYVPGPYSIIPNGVDIKHFSADVLPINEFRDGKLNILFLGRLERRKGLDYLLQAYREVKRQVPNSRLLIVGPGTRRPLEKYQRWVSQDGLEDVVFKGFVSYNDLPRYYKTADVYCSPATGHESFGIVLLEAMAVGTPVVASNIKGYARVVNDGQDGCLVMPKDSHDLARCLIALLNDGQLRKEMGAEGIKTAAQYNWELVSQQILDFYGSLLGKSGIKNDFENMPFRSLP